MAEKVTKLALTSRIIVLVLQLLANFMLPDHHPDVFRSPTAQVLTATSNETNVNTDLLHTDDKPTWLDKTVDFCLGGLRHWDAEYFLHIAEHSYSYENTLAFYPLYPLLVGKIACALHYIGLGLTLRSWTLLVAITLNMYLFCKTANVLYALTLRLTKDAYKSWYAAMLYCFNPASIFFSAAYSETLFSFLTFSLMLECVSEQRMLRLLVYLSLSIVTRSNGLTNMGFVIYFLMRTFMLRATQRCSILLKLCIVLLSSLLPLSVFYHYAFKFYCQQQTDATSSSMSHSKFVVAYAHTRNYILAGSRQAGNSPWCDATFPNPYNYIQSHYWNVGFLRYYEWKQLPNFILALPALCFLLRRCSTYLQHVFCSLHSTELSYMQRLKEHKSLPFILHAAFLTIFCAIFVHVQITTRLLCAATPCIYWFGADYFDKPLDQIRLRSKPGMILSWFASYAFFGTILFSNNLPWT